MITCRSADSNWRSKYLELGVSLISFIEYRILRDLYVLVHSFNVSYSEMYDNEYVYVGGERF